LAFFSLAISPNFFEGEGFRCFCVNSHQDGPPILTTMTHPPVAVVIV
jgi:hypothetical protein